MSDMVHLVAGALVAGEGEKYARRSPVDGSPLDGALASIEQASLAAETAHAAQPAMAALGVTERRAALLDLAARLETDSDPLAALVTMENGCPSAQAAGLQVGSAVGLLRAYADLIETFTFEERRAGLRGGTTHILRQPVGAALGIVPWNVPLFLACMKLAPAICAGCAVVLKPSPESLGSMGRFAAHLAELPLPKGAVQSVTGDVGIGRAMVADARFAKVSFTGSTAAGRQVGIAAMERFARVTLELGGKGAAILLDDLNPADLPDELWLAMMQNNGQVCGAQSRILVPASRAAAYEEGLVALVDGMRFGDPLDTVTQIGPVVSFAAAERISAMVSADVTAGGTLLTASRPAPGDAYVAPALIRPSAPDAAIITDELFGPVATVQTYRTQAEAIAMANEHRYGLSGSVWSADPERAAILARSLKTGTVGINSKKILDFGSPFGGWRESGVGRELGPEGIASYTETTTILAP